MLDGPDIQTLPEDEFRRALVVVAHPDDVEYGLSAVVHRWVRRGIEVSYLLLTAGEAGMQRAPEEVARLRAAEQREACDIVGVKDLEILSHPDGLLAHTSELRRDIARTIRRVRPDVVVSGTWEIEVPWGLNHVDHRVAGLATVDACRDADNRWLFTELLDEGLEPWHASHLLIYGGSGRPTHGVPLAAEDVDAGVRSLEAHREYLADLPDHPVPAEFIPEVLAAQGQALGVDHGYLFRHHAL